MQQSTLLRMGRMRIKRRVETKKGRAIGADDFPVLAHVEKYVRMVVGRCGAHAHEFFGTDLDHRHAQIVLEMGDDVFRHGKSFNAAAPLRGEFRRTIARQAHDA